MDDALNLKKKEIDESYKQYVNPQLVNLLNLLGLNKNFIKAENTKVWDDDGRVYLDFLGAYGALNVGHNNEFIKNSIEKAMQFPNLLQIATNPITSLLAKNLASITPSGLKHTFFCNSGAEAVEGALKLAKIATGKSRIIYCEGSFHGKSMGALSVTGRDKYKKYFGPLVPLSHEIPYGDLEALKRSLASYEDVAAFIIEPIQGEGGIIIPPAGYLKKAKEVCKRHNVLFIADEVQTGFGRTGYWFACESEDVSPDILCMAKALGGGIMPIGAYISTKEVWQKAYGSMERCLLHTSTFGGNTWASAAAMATIQYIDENDLAQEAKEKGEYLLSKLQDLKNKYSLLKDVRGRGLMIGLEFNSITKNKLLNTFLKGKVPEMLQEYIGGLVAMELLNKHGIITAYTLNNPNVIRIEPPLTITYEEIDTFILALEDTLITHKNFGKLAINNFKNIFDSITRS
ncbi:MAG: aspartate aminotransferase family protein [Clostridiaceae bacterium]|nr:aspartate aminotransferase family protein [Clostridiaceae bacterium]